jgi:hypothetical protein
MDSKYVLPESIVLELNGGRIALGAAARAWDEYYHHLIVVELPGRTPLYGEWDGDSVGSTNISNRLAFSPNERTLVEGLILSLFSNAAATATLNPFALKVARYTGVVRFVSRWIREQ